MLSPSPRPTIAAQRPRAPAIEVPAAAQRRVADARRNLESSHLEARVRVQHGPEKALSASRTASILGARLLLTAIRIVSMAAGSKHTPRKGCLALSKSSVAPEGCRALKARAKSKEVEFRGVKKAQLAQHEKAGAAEGTRTPAWSLASCPYYSPILRPRLDENFITRWPAVRQDAQEAAFPDSEPISSPEPHELTSPPEISFAAAQSSRPLRDRYRRGQISGHLRRRRSPANDDAFDACLCPVLCAFWFSSRFGPVVVTEISQVPSPAASITLRSSRHPSAAFRAMVVQIPIGLFPISAMDYSLRPERRKLPAFNLTCLFGVSLSRPSRF